MARIKSKELRKMTNEERKKKMEELKLELLKSKASASKTGTSRTKEVKILIAKLLTLEKEGGKK